MGSTSSCYDRHRPFPATVTDGRGGCQMASCGGGSHCRGRSCRADRRSSGGRSFPAMPFHGTDCTFWRKKSGDSGWGACGVSIRHHRLRGSSRSVRTDERSAEYRDDSGWAASAGTGRWGTRRWGARGSERDCQNLGWSVPDNVKLCRCARMRDLAQAGGLYWPILQIRESLTLSSRMSRFHHPRRTSQVLTGIRTDR